MTSNFIIIPESCASISKYLNLFWKYFRHCLFYFLQSEKNINVYHPEIIKEIIWGVSSLSDTVTII